MAILLNNLVKSAGSENSLHFSSGKTESQNDNVPTDAQIGTNLRAHTKSAICSWLLSLVWYHFFTKRIWNTWYQVVTRPSRDYRLGWLNIAMILNFFSFYTVVDGVHILMSIHGLTETLIVITPSFSFLLYSVEYTSNLVQRLIFNPFYFIYE